MHTLHAESEAVAAKDAAVIDEFRKSHPELIQAL